MGTKRLFQRFELSWIALASSSLPVPDSPCIRTADIRRRDAAKDLENARHLGTVSADAVESEILVRSTTLGIGVFSYEPPAGRPVRQGSEAGRY